MSEASRTPQSPIDTVSAAFEDYAQRGVFRGFSRGPVRSEKVTFTILWHARSRFDLIFDARKNLLRFPFLLPNVPSKSPMYAAFKKFLKSRQADALPSHRRIDRDKAEVRPYNRAGNVSLTLKVKDGDYEYGARKMVHLVNEIFLVFLSDGMYYEYMIENFGLDPG